MEALSHIHHRSPSSSSSSSSSSTMPNLRAGKKKLSKAMAAPISSCVASSRFPRKKQQQQQKKKKVHIAAPPCSFPSSLSWSSCSSRPWPLWSSWSSSLPSSSSPSSPSSPSSSGRRGRTMMSHGSSKASGGYAAALAEAADAEGILEAVMSDMQILRQALADPSHGHGHGQGRDGAGLQSFLLDPTVLDEHKKDVVETLGREAAFCECTLKLLRLIIERRRASILADMVDRFEEIYNKITATEPVLVISAIKIDISRLALIATKVQRLTGATNVRLRNTIDPSLVAGFVVRYGKHGSLLLDLSVKSQLAQLARCISLPPDPPA